ncbi:hypothetical protein J5Y03_15070 [Bacillus sp. RG28]|uniref:YkoS n=1 Tax=Gottfriedia endophytica TaxID=2820819 RepID=A0A940SKI3_9BACI|nr:DUF6044 family protein [Gottfriedia endophytica]MBP0726481.1 hypothetical protein [Gottfriedia endophytica]
MFSLENKISNERKHLFFAWVLLVIYILPMFILGENSHFRIHDNMDSNIAWYKVLAESGQIFGPINGTIPQIINGLPRNALGTGFSGIVWLHALLPSMLAYSLSQTITRVFAFIGMYLLLKDHFVKSNDTYLIRVWVSLAFALTPFWPSGMLSTLGQPLALWAFLNIRKGKSSWKDWVTLLLIPFYSSFVLGFFFFLFFIGIIWLRDLIVTRRWNIVFLGSIAFMTCIFLLTEYRLVYSLIFNTGPTSRDEYLSSTLTFWHCIRLSIKNYFLGHTHVMTLHTLVIVPISFLAIWKIIKLKTWQNEKQFVYLFILNILLSIWYAFWFYTGWEPLKEKISLLNTFNFARFHFLRPLIIYLIFAVGSSILWGLGKKWRIIVKVGLILQVLVMFGANPEVYYRIFKEPSFKQFYAVHQFNEIADYIGKPKSSYRVVSIGIHPAIAQYNGYYTLDTYNNFYPLTYKHEFRKIISKELDKSPTLKDYFDHWGGRCYIFVSELGKNYDYEKNSNTVIQHLQLNTKVLKDMGGQYLFSAVPIKNAKENNLLFLKAFEDKESVWKIYLYKVQ